MSKKHRSALEWAPLEAPLIDSHCHLVPRTFGEETPAVIERAFASGLERAVNIGAGYGMEGNLQALEVARHEPRLHPTIGIHPHDAHLIAEQPELLAQLEALASRPEVVGYGEIGLDFFYDHSSPDQQRYALRAQIALARKLDLPIIVHDRDAHEEILQVLDETGAFEGGVVIHCFSGDWAYAEACLSRGALLSIPGIVTFKNAPDLHEVAARAPLEQLMIETDSPYLAPVPYRGKRNEPAFVHAVAREVARLRGMEAGEVARQTADNARRFFRLPDAPISA